MALIVEKSGESLTVYARIIIYCTESMLLPDDITDMLQLQPTEKRVKGDVICRPSGRIVTTMKKSYWSLCSENLVKSGDMDAHLDWLLKRIVPVKEQIISLQKIPGISMNIRCFWCSRESDTGIDFTTDQIKDLAELNLNCSFVFYFDSDTWDAE
jgi:hypothetical protein